MKSKVRHWSSVQINVSGVAQVSQQQVLVCLVFLIWLRLSSCVSRANWDLAFLYVTYSFHSFYRVFFVRQKYATEVNTIIDALVWMHWHKPRFWLNGNIHSYSRLNIHRRRHSVNCIHDIPSWQDLGSSKQTPPPSFEKANFKRQLSFLSPYVTPPNKKSGLVVSCFSTSVNVMLDASFMKKTDNICLCWSCPCRWYSVREPDAMQKSTAEKQWNECTHCLPLPFAVKEESKKMSAQSREESKRANLLFRPSQVTVRHRAGRLFRQDSTSTFVLIAWPFWKFNSSQVLQTQNPEPVYIVGLSEQLDKFLKKIFLVSFGWWSHAFETKVVSGVTPQYRKVPRQEACSVLSSENLEMLGEEPLQLQGEFSTWN